VSDESTTSVKARSKSAGATPEETKTSSDYVLPMVHVRVPATAVNAGFWGGLAGAVALGAVDPPLGLLVGAGVVIARHQSTR